MMTQSAIELTQFKVERLQCIGGQGRAAPYRITIYRSLELGTIGIVPDWDIDANNAPSFEKPQSRVLTGIQNLFGLK